MSRFRMAGALFTLCVSALSGRLLADRSHPSLPAAPRTLTTVFTYKATVPEVPAGTKSLQLWIPIPSNSEWQTIDDVQVEAPASHRITTERKYSNRMVALTMENPSAPMVVTVKFKVTRKEARVFSESFHADRPGKFNSRLALAADSRVPITGKFADMARELTAGKTRPLDQLHAIFEYVVENMQYDYKKESPKLGEGDVAFVCDYKKGNCSDLHSFIISMARSLGIPAVLEFGFPVTGIPVPNPVPKEGTVSGYHCWTWFKDPEKGWAPLDACDSRRWADSKKPEMKDYLFGNLLLERSAVAFSRGRDITLNPPQHGPALNYFIYPYAEADGSSIKVNWEVRYILAN